MKTEPVNTMNLSAGQLESVRDLINDKQDVLFDKLHALPDELKHGPSGDGLRENLRYWDAIRGEVSRVASIAWNRQHMEQASR